MTYITNTAIEVINFVKSKGIEIRFSSEDSFRSGKTTCIYIFRVVSLTKSTDLVDLLSIYSAVDQVGVHRVGIADTVGVSFLNLHIPLISS